MAYSLELKVEAESTVDVPWDKDTPKSVSCDPPCEACYCQAYSVGKESKAAHIMVHNPTAKSVATKLVVVAVGDPEAPKVVAEPAKSEKKTTKEVLVQPLVLDASAAVAPIK